MFVDQLIDDDLAKTLAHFKQIIATNKTAHYRNVSKAKSRPVFCVESGQVFESVNAAAVKHGVSPSAIRQSINRHTAVNHRFHFRYDTSS